MMLSLSLTSGVHSYLLGVASMYAYVHTVCSILCCKTVSMYAYVHTVCSILCCKTVSSGQLVAEDV